MDDFGLRDLALVGAVADHRSFRGAAREFALPPSSVSHVIAQVERRLGIRLFLRNTRSVALTEAGQSFLIRVRPALAEIAQAVGDVRELRDQPSGLVRISASSWGAERILPIIMEFQRAYPEVRVDLVTEGRIIDIIAEGFDAGLRLAAIVPQDMVAISLGIPEALILVAAPSYLAERGTPATPGDLIDHECIRPRLPSGSIMPWEFSNGTKEAIVAVKGRLIVGSTDLAVRAAAMGSGIAYADAREAQPFVETGQLVQILPDWTPALDSESLYYPAQRFPSAALRTLIQFVRETSINEGSARLA